MRSDAANEQQIIATILTRLANRAIQNPELRVEPPHGAQAELQPVDPKIPPAHVRQFVGHDRPELRSRKTLHDSRGQENLWTKHPKGDWCIDLARNDEPG